MRRELSAAVAAVVLLFGSASTARAITITVDSLTMLPGNTPFTLRTDNRSHSFDSAVNIVNSGGSAADAVGNSVAATTRYAWTQTADADGVFPGEASLTATSNYRVVFTVTPAGSATVYDVVIDTARIGALVTRDEGGASATATINAVTGTLNGVGQAELGLAGPLTRNNTNTGFLNVNQTNSLVLNGLTGAQTITLDFLWTNYTQSSNGIAAGDEGVVLFGLDTRINGRVGAADDYPGTSGRTNPDADGHFVTITATVTQIPEPSTLAMALVAGIGIAVYGWRRRV